jgi:hypothetical protein
LRVASVTTRLAASGFSVPPHGVPPDVSRPEDPSLSRIRWLISLVARDRGAWAHNLAFTRHLLERAEQDLDLAPHR